MLQAKLDEMKVAYELCNDTDLMIQKGFMSSPMAEVDGKAMNFMETINWLKERISR